VAQQNTPPKGKGKFTLAHIKKLM